ncbi:hypothetical protein [Pedobacter aquatilis]|uniref:hypothetical protein n=1 Tax=Pedobacter aquatilis TaxID=351343 RepID=UPI002930D3AF|nr:hypothetical protein [Pedobacter aquatilis]
MKIKTLVPLFSLAVTSLNVNAQESKLKNEKISFLGTELKYKTNNESLKNGAVVLTDAKSANIIVKGFYKDNLPAGNWYFYGATGLETSYNYDQKKTLFIDTALISKNVVSIKSSNQEIVEKASIPVLLYPKDLFVKTVVEELTKIRTADSAEFHLEIITDISNAENIKYAVKYFENGKAKTQALKLGDLPLPVNWVPAMFNKEFIPAEVKMKVLVSGLKFADDNSKRLRWDN